MLVKISLARLLKVKPQAAKKFITVLAGSAIERGDVIARKKGFFGKQIVIKSRIAGLVDHYSSDTGELVIRTDDTGGSEALNHEGSGQALKNPPVGGESTEKSSTETQNLADTESTEKKRAEKKLSKIPKIGKNVIKGVFGFGKGEGKLEICDACLEFTKLNKDDEGKIILSKTISSNVVIYKASALGVEGLVVLYCRFRPKNKDVGFLILSDKQDDKLWQKLKKWEGKMVRVEGEEISCV